MPTPTLRTATANDLAAIEKLLNDAHLPTEGVAHLIREVPGSFVVADSGGALVAAGALEPAGGDALLRSVVVRDDARSTGVGRALVERLLQGADSRRVPGVFLLTTTADRWFPRFGFERTDRASVPAGVAATWEFRMGCSQTAIAMKRCCPGT